jgi:hypothetical protein
MFGKIFIHIWFTYHSTKTDYVGLRGVFWFDIFLFNAIVTKGILLLLLRNVVFVLCFLYYKGSDKPQVKILLFKQHALSLMLLLYFEHTRDTSISAISLRQCIDAWPRIIHVT